MLKDYYYLYAGHCLLGSLTEQDYQASMFQGKCCVAFGLTVQTWEMLHAIVGLSFCSCYRWDFSLASVWN